MTHPGIPCIFWEHFYDDQLGEQISKLAALRRRAGIRADSKIVILAAEPDMYVARINGKVTCKFGPRYDMGDLVPNKADGWTLSHSGDNWAVWERNDD